MMTPSFQNSKNVTPTAGGSVICFFASRMQILVKKSISAGRNLLLKWLMCIWRYAHRCLVSFAYRFFCVILKGIDDFAGGFM